MQISLRLKNYKKIDSAILNDLTRVNYLVGPNGSGKSSILNALSHLNDGSNSKRFFSVDSLVEFTAESKSRYLKWEKKEINPNHTSDHGNLRINIIFPEEADSEKGANNVKTSRFPYANVGKEQHDFLNQSSEKIGIPPTKADRIRADDDAWSNEVGRRVFVDGNRGDISLSHVASGLKAINNILHVLRYIPGNSGGDIILLLLEEPENHLHPDLQKKIPQYIDDFLNELSPEIKSKVCLFITTHSPFIISNAAEYENQKVYLLKNGMLCDLEQNQVEESSGYKSHECASIVAQMLGADITDLGYPTNYAILEEYSLQVILEDARQKHIIKNVGFISASGWTRSVSLSETLNEIDKLNTILKCNPFYVDKYYLILDNLADMPAKETQKVQKLKEKLGDRFKELKCKSLEEYYNNIDTEIYQSCITELNASEKKNHGFIKAKYAVAITERISNAKDFSRMFQNELDFLLLQP